MNRAWTLDAKAPILGSVAVVLLLCAALAATTGSAETIVAESQVTALRLAMPQLGHKQRIWIYLPANYHQTSNERYPVLYMQDGQDLFETSDRSFPDPYLLESVRRQLRELIGWYGSWRIEQSLDHLVSTRQLDALIVVGVSSDGVDRTTQYSPWAWDGASTPEGEAYVAFLVDTLKPYIDRHYRTLSGRDHTAIAGSSLGGLIALYAGLKHQETFSRVAALSPLLTPQALGAPLVSYALQRGKSHPMRIYVDLGTSEQSFGPLDPLRGALRAAGFAKDELVFRFVAHGEHRIDDWGHRFPEVLRWLYGHYSGDHHDTFSVTSLLPTIEH